ncbi:hemerythrin domain-containing protein [Virgibacillus litoralis]|uniref:Hemerythrin-like domain-containing protein n=1 Tax=Virgibacillus litoralis TaxID=578221 RepID=A0ABS4HBN5_9BACI|nr:hemerythrin domain-containing protein [Virgibacillus litoralis]MBP1948306.1 hemerythrin-like domain-containing protein [Virgibacillus litoralis]
MAEHKGIKRHESLQPLSRHHMIGLHLALKLKRAGTEESRLTIEEIKQEADEFWNPNGQQHFREEEEFLLPAYAQYAKIEQPEIIEMLLEHVKIRAQMDNLINGEDVSLDKMHELGMLLEAHIRKEERVIFPMIEKALPEDKLYELAPYLH